MRLTHIEVAYILGITQEQAIKSIILMTESDPNKAKYLVETTKKISVDSEEYDQKYGTKLTFAANDIINNCLNRPAYKKWIMYDWPKKVLDQVRPPKKIQLPVPLRRLIKPEDKEVIQRYWEQNFSEYVSDKWEKKYKPVFEV